MQSDGKQQDEPGVFLPIGRVFGGQYVITGSLALGRRTVFYKCYQQDLPDRELVLAVFKPDLANKEQNTARFKKGVAASYKVSHPNVLRTYEYLTDGDLVAYSMEFAPNGNLDDLLSARPTLEIDEITRIVSQVLAGLQAIHDAGIVHRDLRPKNILFNKDQMAMIAGFSVALVEDAPRLTSHGEVVGTVGYASPEYLANGTVDKRSDLYAIGLLMYEMITGSFPFSDSNPLAAITARLTTDPKSPDTLRKECPEALTKIVMKAIARNPEQRFQSASEMREELEKLNRPEPVREAAAQAEPTAMLADAPAVSAAPKESAPVQKPAAEILEIRNDVLHRIRPTPKLTPPARRFRARAPMAAAFAVVALMLVGGALNLFSNAPELEIAKNATAVTATAPTPAPRVAEPKPQPVHEEIAAQDPQPAAVQAESEIDAGRAQEEEILASAPTEERAEEQPRERMVEPQIAAAATPPAAEELAAVTDGSTTEYQVSQGDTVSGLAARFSFSQKEIIRLNSIRDPNLLLAGSRIRLPARK